MRQRGPHREAGDRNDRPSIACRAPRQRLSRPCWMSGCSSSSIRRATKKHFMCRALRHGWRFVPLPGRRCCSAHAPKAKLYRVFLHCFNAAQPPSGRAATFRREAAITRGVAAEDWRRTVGRRRGTHDWQGPGWIGRAEAVAIRRTPSPRLPSYLFGNFIQSTNDALFLS